MNCEKWCGRSPRTFEELSQYEVNHGGALIYDGYSMDCLNEAIILLQEYNEYQQHRHVLQDIMKEGKRVSGRYDMNCIEAHCPFDKCNFVYHDQHGFR